MLRVAPLVLIAFALVAFGCAQRGEEVVVVTEVVLVPVEDELASPDAEIGDDNLVLPQSEFLGWNFEGPLPQTFPELPEPNTLSPQPDNEFSDFVFTPQPERSRRNWAQMEAWGGSEESERAVAIGLMWFERQQKEDGHWEFDAEEKHDRVAATGLALLPFLGTGQTHCGDGEYIIRVDVGRGCPCVCSLQLEDAVASQARERRNTRYMHITRRGLNWLLRNLDADGPTKGRFRGTDNPVSQAIATLALCEAFSLTRDEQLLAPAQAAIDFIVRSQGPNGGWGFIPNSDGDLLVTGWQIQALKAAQLSKDIRVPASTFTNAIGFLNLVSAGSRKAMYTEMANTGGASPATTTTAAGLLCRHLIDGWGPDNAGMTEGVVGLMKRAPRKSPITPPMDFYFHATQLVRFFGGVEWTTWNDGPKDPMFGDRKGGMRDWLVGIQIKKDGRNQGSFDPDAGFVGRNYGRLGTTAFAILTLEVYYRQLPLVKRAAK